MVAGQPAFDPAALQNVQLVRDGHLALVTVNRPSKLNALDDQTIAELDATFAALDQDASVGAVVLTGAGEKAFVAGADIGVLSKQGVLDGKQNALRGQALTLRIENLSKPVVAAITASRSAAAWSWRWRATCASPPGRPSSACPRSRSASSRATAARSGCRGCAAWARRCS